MELFSWPTARPPAHEDEVHIGRLEGTPEEVCSSKTHGLEEVFPIVRSEQHNESRHSVLKTHGL